MSYRILLVIALFVSEFSLSQEKPVLNFFSVSDDVQILNAPRFYANYFSEFKINDTWKLRFEMNQHNIKEDILFEFTLLFNHKLNDKFSFLFGPKFDFFKNELGEIEEISLFSTFGANYNLSNSLSVAGMYNQVLSKESSNIPPVSKFQTKYKLRARLKF